MRVHIFRAILSSGSGSATLQPVSLGILGNAPSNSVADVLEERWVEDKGLRWFQPMQVGDLCLFDTHATF